MIVKKQSILTYLDTFYEDIKDNEVFLSDVKKLKGLEGDEVIDYFNESLLKYYSDVPYLKEKMIEDKAFSVVLDHVEAQKFDETVAEQLINDLTLNNYAQTNSALNREKGEEKRNEYKNV